MKSNYLLLFLLSTINVFAQETKIVTLDLCQMAALERYPSGKKKDLLIKSLDYSLNTISKGYLPQLSGANQLSWQSDVTELPISIPGMNTPEINQTQYKAYTDVNQLIFDGGIIKTKKKSEIANNRIEVATIEVELFTLQERINNLYFGILLINEQLKQNILLQNDIQIGLKTVEAQILNGTSFRSSADILKAELIKVNQQAIALKSSKKAWLDMLSLFTGFEMDDNSILEIPLKSDASTEINRPELKLFEFKNQKLDVEKKLINKRDLPKISLFAQSGMSNPGLNMFEEGVQNYFIGGIRLNWLLTYSKKKEKAVIDIKKEINNTERETFLFNINQQLKQQNSEIQKLEEFLETDDNLIALRTSIKKASLAQLENGVINSNDYLREINEENKAIQNKKSHEIELLLAIYKEKTTKGN